MRLFLRGWTGVAVLFGLLTGWGCGGGGPAPGMLENAPIDAVPKGFELMQDLKKDPAKLRQMINANKQKAKAAGGQ